jgi:putative addiction module CopG family antidote
MTIHLSGEREQLVRALVQGGQYASEDDVIGEALRLLQERDDQAQLAVLRREVALGIEQADRGELEVFDPQATLARVRSRQASGKGHSWWPPSAGRRSPHAEADLDTILDDLNRKDPAVAARYAAEFEQKGHALAQFPELGRSRPEIAPNLRSTLVRPYVIFYRVEGDVVQILRILHGRQDLRSIMQAESEQ